MALLAGVAVAGLFGFLLGVLACQVGWPPAFIAGVALYLSVDRIGAMLIGDRGTIPINDGFLLSLMSPPPWLPWGTYLVGGIFVGYAAVSPGLHPRLTTMQWRHPTEHGAASFAGLPLIYAVAGALSGLAGVLSVARDYSVGPTGASPWGLYGVAAAIIGGASVWGDRGGAHTALLGSVVVVLIFDFTIQHWTDTSNAYWLIFGLAAITLALDGIGGSKDGLTLHRVASAGRPPGMDPRESEAKEI